jgi:hypothetical protein
MKKKFVDKVLEQSGIRGATKDSRENNSILGIRRQYLIPLVAVKL